MIKQRLPHKKPGILELSFITCGMRPNANPHFALAFCSVLSWCLCLTTSVCAVCPLPSFLTLPFPSPSSFPFHCPHWPINQQTTLPLSSWWSALLWLVVPLLGWLCVLMDQFTQIWPSRWQVSLLWEMFYWNPGRKRYPGWWPCPDTNVSISVSYMLSIN